MTRDEHVAALAILYEPSPMKAELERLLLIAQQDRDTVAALAEDLRKKLPSTDAPLGRAAFHEMEDVKPDYENVLDGLTHEMGAKDPRVAARTGKPGLNTLNYLVVRLEDKLKKLQEREAQWPTPETRHPYRYVGKKYKHRQDGIYLEPGAVVELSETQASAWRDRFVLVEESSKENEENAVSATV